MKMQLPHMQRPLVQLLNQMEGPSYQANVRQCTVTHAIGMIGASLQLFSNE